MNAVKLPYMTWSLLRTFGTNKRHSIALTVELWSAFRKYFWRNNPVIKRFNCACFYTSYIDGLEQKRHNPIAKALELRLSCTNPLIWYIFLRWPSIACGGISEAEDLSLMPLSDWPTEGISCWGGENPAPWPLLPRWHDQCHLQKICMLTFSEFIPWKCYWNHLFL